MADIAEDRWAEIARLTMEVLEREARLSHLIWQAKQAGEIRIVGAVVERIDGSQQIVPTSHG